MTDPIEMLYHQELTRKGSPLLKIDLNIEKFPYLFERHSKFLARPMFFAESEMHRFQRDLIALIELLVSLPERLFDGDVDRVCQALGIDATKARPIGPSIRHPSAPFGRVDAYHDGCSLRVLEFNATSQCGLMDWVAPAAHALLEFDAFRSFASAHCLRYIDTTALVAQELRTVGAAVSSGPDPVIALIEGPGGLAPDCFDEWELLRRLLQDSGLQCHLGELDDLQVRNGRVTFGAGQAPIDVIYRLFHLGQVVDNPQALAMTEQLRDLSRDGRLALWTPLDTEILTNKLWMAYLSEPRLRSHLSEGEKQLVDRMLPWTRKLSPTSPMGNQELLEVCHDRREHLILKPGASFAGRGVICGWQVDDRRWTEALHNASAAGAIVQERVVPRQEPVFNPETGQTEPWDACLGLFWLHNGLAGGGARLVPSGQPFGTDPARRKMAGIYLYPEGPEANSSENSESWPR